MQLLTQHYAKTSDILPLFSFSTALTTPLNLGGYVTDYLDYTKTQNCSLEGSKTASALPLYVLYMSLLPIPVATRFIYIVHLVSIDLQLSRLCNSPTLALLHIITAKIVYSGFLASYTNRIALII